MEQLREAFARHYEKVRAHFSDLFARVALPSSDGALPAFGVLATKLRARLRVEEQLASSGLAASAGAAGSRLASLPRAHEPMRDLLREIERALATEQLPGVAANLRELESAFELHQRQLEAALSTAVNALAEPTRQAILNALASA